MRYHRHEFHGYGSAPYGRDTREQQARGVLLERAERLYTAEEFADLLDDLAKDRIEVRLYEDGICLTRTYT
jgi:hypothetical protein